ncbi:MAG TPA: hypothetical protein VGM90_00125 [Kofleriaceae bacterium]
MGRWKFLAAFVVLVTSRDALSQNATTGAIRGRAIHAAKSAFAGQRVVVTDERLVAHAATLDDDGSFVIDGLLPGHYLVALTDSNPDSTTPSTFSLQLDVLANTSVQIVYDRKHVDAIALDPTSAALQFSTDGRFLNVPLTSRYTDGLTSHAPTSRSDSQGTAFGDTTSYDNRDILDGLDTTSPSSAGFGTQVPVEFLGATTTTYAGAQSGRSLGAQIASVLRSGTNTPQGSVFARFYGSPLRGARDRIATGTSALDVSSELARGYQLGAAYGGPIVPDHVWYFVGAAAQLALEKHTLTLRSLQDVDRNFAPDRDRNGLIWNRVSSADYHGSDFYVPLVARVDEATTTQQGSLSLVVFPQRLTTPAMDSSPTTAREYTALTGDLAAHWRGELGAGFTLDVGAGWHRRRSTDDAQSDAAKSVAQHIIAVGNFAGYAAHTAVSPNAMAVCSDGGADDRSPLIENCPISRTLASDGVGLRSTYLDERRVVNASLTKRVRLGGVHELRASASFEREHAEYSQVYSGGQFVDDGLGGPMQNGLTYKLVRYAPPGETGAEYPDNCRYSGSGNETLPCKVLGGVLGEPDSVVASTSNIIGSEISDVWQPVAQLSITGALRFDREHLGGATLYAYGSPRLSAVFSPLDDGRAKLFAQFARSTELLPASSATSSSPVRPLTTGTFNIYGPPSVFAFDPNLKPGSRDEWIGGGAYQFDAGTVVQASWTHRHLRRAIDDISIDGTATYQTTDPTDPAFTGSVLSNPGEGLAADREHARRDSDAFTLTASHRVAENWFFDAAYTRSSVHGNYPGVLDDLSGQLASAHGLHQFDVSGQSNLDGVLSEDRPDRLRLAGAYTKKISASSALVLGARFTAMSGAPRATLDETGNFLLPTDAIGRTDFVHQLDLHLAGCRQLSSTVAGELYIDVFNVYNSQPTFAVDSNYSSSAAPAVSPIDGGTYEDLIWLKETRSTGTTSVTTPAQRNERFGRTVERYAPISAIVGARLTF